MESSNPIRRAWAAWEAHERRTAVQLRIPELHLTVEDEAASVSQDREAVAASSVENRYEAKDQVSDVETVTEAPEPRKTLHK